MFLALQCVMIDMDGNDFFMHDFCSILNESFMINHEYFFFLQSIFNLFSPFFCFLTFKSCYCFLDKFILVPFYFHQAHFVLPYRKGTPFSVCRIVGMGGIGESLLLVAFCGTCTFLTGISLSAIATNGAMKVQSCFYNLYL